MALNERKIVNYANPVANLPDHPSQEGWTAAQLKAAFDANANGEIKTAINAIIDDLVAIADGASGADNIGATAITDLDGATVQALIESLRNKLKSIIDGSSGADFINATAIFGLDGTTVQALLEALKTYIDTHKSSTDHDGRYYTETELKATDGVTGSNVIGTPAISGVNGTTVKDQLASLKTLLVNALLGQIVDGSLTNVKLADDIKVGSLANLTTEHKASLVGAINEHETEINGKEPTITKKTAFNVDFETSTANIKANGDVSVGTSNNVARADHVHQGNKNNYTATASPTLTDDTTKGYSIDSTWIDTTNDKFYKCLDSTENNAIWQSYIIGSSTVFRYGYRRDRNDSNPNTRISYLHDALGYNPASMNFSSGNFDYGSWQNFVEEISRPVMLKNDGTVDYELQRSDFTKKLDGTASDVSNTSYAGNAMIEFKKLYIKRYSDSQYDYVIFSSIQIDNDYKAYAHQNKNGTVNDAFYWGAYKGSNISSKLRSIADQTIMVSQTRNTEVSYATAIGSGYYTIYKSGWDFIGDLLTLISKSDDSQTKFGSGRSKTTNTTAIATGTTKSSPYFWGSNNETSDVKIFGIEGFWGNVWESMAGLILNSGIKVKMTPSYNFDGTGYTSTGITPSGTNGGYVSVAQSYTKNGYIPSVASGSSSTYYCDGLWFNNSQVDYPLVGGNWDRGLRGGSRFVSLADLASTTDTSVGSRLSYLSPA